MLSPEVVMNLLPEVLDCVGYSHNHSPLISSNRNSPFERLWRVSHQTDYTIRELLIKRPNCRAVELNESNRRFQFQKRSQLFIRTHAFAQPKVQPRFLR
jgi:hypothetical protein